MWEVHGSVRQKRHLLPYILVDSLMESTSISIETITHTAQAGKLRLSDIR